MPRPKNGYTNAAGQQVPGTHDITGRYKDSRGLMYWIHQEGLKGNVNPYASAADIGTAVHKMCELDLRGATNREIEAVPHQMLSTPADVDKIWQSFRAFQAWRQEHRVQAIAFEESLVSEAFQYRGTYDVVAFVDGVRSLIDFKTCKDASRVFLEQRIVMAAHGNLWHEAHPDMPIHAYHLINLPKDGSKFGHHAFADLSPEFEMFTLQLDCWRVEKGLTRKRTTKPATVVPAPKAALLAEAAAPAQQATEAPAATAKPKRARKPKAEKVPAAKPVVVDAPVAQAPVPERAPAAAPVAGIIPPFAPPPVQLAMMEIAPPPPAQLSMAAILRANGHVREAA
jgi:hypothetical protein